MKFTCDQSDLNSCLSLVVKAVPSRPSHPVLANVLIKVDKELKMVCITGFDLSLGIQSAFSAVVEESGILTVPAKLFIDIVSRMEGDLSLALDSEDENLIHIKSGSGKYNIRGMSADEFPELPEITGDQIELPAKELIKGLKGTLFSASPDETKQVLTGVHIVVSSDQIEFASTDGHRLTRMQTPIEDGADIAMTIPARALKEVEKMLSLSANSSLESVAIRFDDSQIVFEMGTQKLTSRKLEGQYPIYNQLIPNKFTGSITIDRKAFLGSAERIGVLADQRNNILKCSIDHDAQSISLSVDAKEVGNGEESVAVQCDGDLKEIAFNIKYLTEGLKSLNCSEVQIQLNTATSPVVVKPLTGEKIIYLIMPVQLRN